MSSDEGQLFPYVSSHSFFWPDTNVPTVLILETGFEIKSQFIGKNILRHMAEDPEQKYKLWFYERKAKKVVKLGIFFYWLIDH